MSPVSAITIELVGMRCHTNHTNTRYKVGTHGAWALIINLLLLFDSWLLPETCGWFEQWWPWLPGDLGSRWGMEEGLLGQLEPGQCHGCLQATRIPTTSEHHICRWALCNHGFIIHCQLNYYSYLQLSLLRVMLLLHLLPVLEMSFICRPAHHFNFRAAACALQDRVSC